MACRNCKYFDENERSGQKGYCEYYRQYCYDTETCSHFVSRDSGSGGCFFTSACCAYKGLPDDCTQLTVLRTFRDGYLKNTKNGMALIEEYYAVAPSIVSSINNSANKDEEYEAMFCEIEKCVSLIEGKKNEEALEHYCSMVNRYKAKYKGVILWVFSEICFRKMTELTKISLT